MSLLYQNNTFKILLFSLGFMIQGCAVAGSVLVPLECGTRLEADVDSINFMQLTEYQTAAIASARFALAVEHRKALHDTANFAVQNFVKRDELRRWTQSLPFHLEEDQVVLAFGRCIRRRR